MYSRHPAAMRFREGRGCPASGVGPCVREFPCIYRAGCWSCGSGGVWCSRWLTSVRFCEKAAYGICLMQRRLQGKCLARALSRSRSRFLSHPLSLSLSRSLARSLALSRSRSRALSRSRSRVLSLSFSLALSLLSCSLALWRRCSRKHGSIQGYFVHRKQPPLRTTIRP